MDRAGGNNAPGNMVRKLPYWHIYLIMYILIYIFSGEFSGESGMAMAVPAFPVQDFLFGYGISHYE